MSKYLVAFTKEAADDLTRIKKYYARQITSRIEKTLADNAEEVTRTSVKKLRGFESLYRLRVGQYRIFYQVHTIEVSILRVLSKDQEEKFYREAEGYEGDTNI
jgi:addiction module RelE/StbE family toxin